VENTRTTDASTTVQPPRGRGAAAATSAAPVAADLVRRRQRIKLLLILLVCAAPVIASYLAYYVVPPAGRTNYGDLIEPQRPLPALTLRRDGSDGERFDVGTLRGQWLMVQIDSGACDPACRDKLLMMRQQRTMTGKDRDRIERIWLITDAAPVSAETAREHEGTLMLRADRAELDRLFPPAAGGRIEDHIFLVDPVGNLMMRLPRDADPNRVKRDIARLLKASRVG